MRRVGDGHYAAAIDSDYVLRNTERAHGGYLLATLLRAVVAESPHSHPIATTAHFLRPGVEGPVEIRLESHRPGRTVATTRARLIQNGTTLIDATVTCATLSNSDTPEWTTPPPPMPPPDECLATAMDHPLGPGPSFLKHLDMRFDPGTMLWAVGQPSSTPEIRTYFRLTEDDNPDAATIALAVDAKPPASFSLGILAPITTIELTLHLRAQPAPGWLTIRATTRRIADGWADEDVDVWDSTGQLVAHSRQLMRLVKPKA